MSLDCTPDQVKSWRDRRYRRRQELRVRTVDQALDFVNDVGFCFVFSGQGLEMPTLWEAVCGAQRPLPAHHDDVDLGRTWDWKDELPTRGQAYYGRWLHKKPMLLALCLLPYLYALSDNYGDVEDYLTEYRDGRLSEEARRVYEALMKAGPQPTSHLRRLAGLAGKASAPRFDRAVAELQLGLKITKVGISDANAWGYCYVYDLFLRRFPGVAQQAEKIPGDSARQELVRAYLSNVAVATLGQMERLFGWPAAGWRSLVDGWIQQGVLASGVRVDGWPGEYLATPDFASSLS